MQDPEEVRNKVEKLLNDDPTLTDPTKIITRVEKVGPIFKKRIELKLEGKVANEQEKHKVNQILNSHFRDSLTIDNQITVE